MAIILKVKVKSLDLATNNWTSTSTAMLFPKAAIISLNLSVGAEVL